MITDISMSGVTFTHDMNTGAPYYIINYDDISGSTETVTSGHSEYSNRTLFIYIDKIDEIRSSRFQLLINAVRELELITRNNFLDIEFAVTKEGEAILFQVRDITNKKIWSKKLSDKFKKLIDETKLFYRNRNCTKRGLYGDKVLLSQMSDWNPAEMIGRSPRQLSYSLYEILITKEAWRIARKKWDIIVHLSH